MNAEHLSALFWSQWAAGDLPWGARIRGAWHVRRCAGCRAEARAMREEQAVYVQSDAFVRGLADLQKHQAVASPVAHAPVAELHPWFTTAWTCGLAAFVMAMWQLPPEAELLRAKGDAAHFDLYIQRGQAVSPLGATCRGGDAVRASYDSAMRYLLVVETDGNGHVQVVFPAYGETSASITPGRQLTPGSWILDASSGQERFVALFTKQPLTLASSRACIEDAAACDETVVRREVACDKD